LLLCEWLVFATNTTAAQLGAQEVWVAYRCRWQVEMSHPHYSSSGSLYHAQRAA
jgi:hypothetical protein